MKNITVIGAGTMGNGIAHVFTQSGYNVQLFDISEAALERAVATIAKNIQANEICQLQWTHRVCHT